MSLASQKSILEYEELEYYVILVQFPYHNPLIIVLLNISWLIKRFSKLLATSPALEIPIIENCFPPAYLVT